MMAPVAAWGRRKGGMVEGKEGSREGGERVGGRKEGREREWEEEGGWREGGERKQEREGGGEGGGEGGEVKGKQVTLTKGGPPR